VTGPFRNSISRWNGSWMLRLALGGVLLIPLIFGGLLVWAYWNPLGNTGNLPAAIVNEDVAVDVDGQTIAAGQSLMDQVVADQQLDWTVTDNADAEEGLNSGRYYLILKVPSDFSAEIASLDTKSPRQANLEVVTNDATNYLVGAFAEDSVREIEGQASQNLQFEFLDHVYSAMGALEEEEQEILNGADKLADAAGEAADDAETVASGAAKVADGNKKAAEIGQQISEEAKKVPEAAEQIADVADTVATDSQNIETSASEVDKQLAEAESKLEDAGETALAEAVADARSAFEASVLTPTKDLATVTRSAADDAKKVAASSQQVVTNSEDASKKLTELADESAKVSNGATELADDLSNELAPGAEKLSEGLNRAAAKVPPVTDAQKSSFTEVLAEPIKVTDTRWNPVNLLGEGFAPYFLPLALYVGAMLLLLLIAPLNERILHLGRPIRAALQSYAPLVFFGAIATTVMLAGVVALVGVRAAAYFPLLLVSLASIACFIAIVQFLKSALGVVGSYTAVVLLVLQVTSNAGAFPIEMLGRFFQFLHPIMPMTYSVDGIRRAIAGGPLWPYLGQDLLVLVAVTLIFLAGTTYIAQRRKLVVPAVLHPEVEIK
jgi:putative membrane protein